MSLLHDALKKSEQKELIGGETAVVDDAEPNRPFPSRQIVVAGLAFVILVTLVWFQFFRTPARLAITPKSMENRADAQPAPNAAQLSEEALTQFHSGHWQEAKDRFEKVVTLEPRNAEAYNNLGLALKKMGDNEAAMEQYRKALALDDHCVPCLNNLGVLYLTDRNLIEAAHQFEKAIALDANYADPHFHLALVLEAKGDSSGAKTHFLKFLELAKNLDADSLLKVERRIATLKNS